MDNQTPPQDNHDTAPLATDHDLPAQSTLLPDSPQPSLTQLIEALLFVAAEPMTLDQLTRILDVEAAEVVNAIDELSTIYAQRGIRLQRHNDHVMFVSAPEAAPTIRRFLGAQQNQRLSHAALETLAIIAYRQPITRAQIDAIRGVDSSAALRALLSRDLICEAGRLEVLGRPILYATTPTFLQQFGLTSLDELPPIEIPEAEKGDDEKE
ncbi:MAG: segregation and condensation protein B [Chloroflexus sp.]|jgi:segregation and condensation protein B|uniref:Segregation and condensation protein B n=1 Tax=Chloroflexus aurantiacus (strain ATCC 29366 / DSM 635 / J-10-fl) TaxID=324602 RepID=A9WDJ2_CHLAA|nr:MULTISPECIES: SMC-Scp complex subunit ScpB [Chloroflexus]ABY37111.1 segregation and condensation protein B [Chloroflexus aurantiacus J-10-fl]RMG50704.1 MAG: SMC-Scp complex subunit ScpB [Chloroflexota bacterium]GIV87235.1 MAG: segregation and condensation protein B [Chloroflexus sp.]HBW66957.1 SMC-Scp complex subunit ScpB [Chloroflexus aurantiacus]